MAKVAPFHSEKEPVYHDDNRCTEGNNIEQKYWRAGTGGKAKCQHCRRLSG